MNPYFNVAGPCIPGEHYMLPAQERCRGLLGQIEQKNFFVIHAARQTGKTTLLLELCRQLNASGDYYAVYCSLEVVQGLTNSAEGIPAIVRRLQAQIEFHESLSQFPFAEHADYSDFTTILLKELSSFCKRLDKPLVIFFDEIDCLSNGTLISFLRQLRDGYVNRQQIPFIHAVSLVGMRNIRDYKAHLRDDRDTLGSASPFNIVSDALSLRNFTQEEVARLYAQHSERTGQDFSFGVVEKVYDQTQGQPWLVNAIAKEIVTNILDSDFSRRITVPHVGHAVHVLITRRDTHIDSLMERLREERVQRIVEPLITGESKHYDLLDDDYRFVLDLGLLREDGRELKPANPIYGEVIIRTLSFRTQREIEDISPNAELPAYLVEGRLDMTRLLTDFQGFWRENSEIWQERFEYKEAAPHLILQAFLQRVINPSTSSGRFGGGRILREMAGGRKRLDLCVEYRDERYPVELKIRYDGSTEAEGIEQLAGYMDTLGCAEGWLLLFDRRPDGSWTDKIFKHTSEHEDKRIYVLGC